MKTLADIKRRVQVGTKMTMTYHIHGAPKLVGVPREVAVVQATQFGLRMPDGRVSWLTWPRARDIRFEDADTFSVLVSGEDGAPQNLVGKVYMTYRFD